jgi:hypothetical protein
MRCSGKGPRPLSPLGTACRCSSSSHPLRESPMGTAAKPLNGGALTHRLLLLSFSHARVWCDREMGRNVLGLQGKCGRMILIDWSTRATFGWWSMNEASWTGLQPRMDERLAAQVLLAPSSRPWAESLFQSGAIPDSASGSNRLQFLAGPSSAFGPHYDLGKIFLYQISLRFSVSILVFYFLKKSEIS